MDYDIANLELVMHELNSSSEPDNDNDKTSEINKPLTSKPSKKNAIKGIAALATAEFEELKSQPSYEENPTEEVYSTNMERIASVSVSMNNGENTTTTSDHLSVNMNGAHAHNVNSKHKPVISSMFDDEYSNNIDIEELNDRDQTKMIQKQKEYEKYGKCACGYKLFRSIWLFRTLIFNIMFLLTGLAISEYIVDNILDNRELSWRVWFYTIYFSILIFCISITRLVLILLMKILRKMTKNSWKVFYIKGINKRLSMTVLSISWMVTFYIFGGVTHYDYNENIFAFMQCIALSSVVFLCSHLFIRYIALNSYFGIFKQRARKIKAYNTFIEIMLNKTNTESDSLFCIPIMNFLIDFPSYDDVNDARKNLTKTASFTFQINPTQKEKDKIKELASNGDKKYKNDTKHNDEIQSLLDAAIYSINLQKTSNSAKLFKLIKEQTLDRLTRVISYLILVRLNDIKHNLILKLPESSTNKNMFRNTFRMTIFDVDKLELANVKDNDKINRDVFVKTFEQYPKPNKKLLVDLGELAWKKFKDKDSGYLNANVLNINIRQIIRDLLQLKQSVDSYIVIINNLQQMMDIMTPILLLFVYLYIFNFNLQETVTLYVSSVGIIGFFGSSYFSSVFASISFILTLNPFLVGDYIMYNNVVYCVEEIALISCVFRQMANGYSYTFQNKQLGQSSHPIINFSRSNKLKYKWLFYFKPCDMTHQQIHDFAETCKEKIKERRDYELKNLKKSYCTYSELKGINYKSIKAKGFELDEFGRKKIKVQMKYEEYCNDVQSLCFNTITQVIKELGYDCDPLQIIKQKVEIPKRN